MSLYSKLGCLKRNTLVLWSWRWRRSQSFYTAEGEYLTLIVLWNATLNFLASCDKSFFVAKDELDIINIITCPLPGCGRSWCKSCSQIVDDITQTHSCDGTEELQRLMGANGWKYCPGVNASFLLKVGLTIAAGCRTPAEKTGGCNHMAVRTHYSRHLFSTLTSL